MVITAQSGPNLPPDKAKQFRSSLLDWHKAVDRSLPWKKTKDPYKIWVSEIILQQTRVSQGLSYYQRFIKAFPDIYTLAAANDKDVLAIWKGLGYYRRPLNMLKTARAIVMDHSGLFPTNYESLLQLPGVGPYTAAAIASFAFGVPKAVVDGNVTRVIARYFGINEPVDKTSVKKKISLMADGCLDSSDPGRYNQAIMDFGALVCKPSNPNCKICPHAALCTAHTKNTIDQIPSKSKRILRKKRYIHYFLVQKEDKIALQKRTDSDIWKGLYELPSLETEKIGLKPLEHRFFFEKQGIDVSSIRLVHSKKHILTHREIFAHFYEADVNNETISARWYDLNRIDDLPIPRHIDQFLKLCF